MTVTLAVAGKGGVGKTTVAALLIKFLSQRREGSILAIDADPSSNLHITLGMDLEWTVGEIREEMLEQVKASLLGGGAAMGTLPGGQTKRDYLEYHVHSALVEGSRFDLIAMGRPEGPGCYCAVNHNLRQVIDDLSRHYQWVVIDNEAGMEHLSRRTTRDVQHLLVVSDPTPRGLVAAQRIVALSRELDIRVEKVWLVLNRVPAGELSPFLRQEIEKTGAPLLGCIPHDEQLLALEVSGQPLIALAEESPSYQALAAMLERIV